MVDWRGLACPRTKKSCFPQVVFTHELGPSFWPFPAALNRNEHPVNLIYYQPSTDDELADSLIVCDRRAALCGGEGRHAAAAAGREGGNAERSAAMLGSSREARPLASLAVLDRAALLPRSSRFSRLARALRERTRLASARTRSSGASNASGLECRDDPTETIDLIVGDLSVAVTNAGAYVFLLEKCINYPISTFPVLTNLLFTAVDDCPSGMRDIYAQTPSGAMLPEYVKPCYSNLPHDRNGGCIGRESGGVRYYARGTSQRMIIRRMLMDGFKVDESEGRCITFGSVCGLGKSGSGHAQMNVATGFFYDADGDNNYHPTHD